MTSRDPVAAGGVTVCPATAVTLPLEPGVNEYTVAPAVVLPPSARLDPTVGRTPIGVTDPTSPAAIVNGDRVNPLAAYPPGGVTTSECVPSGSPVTANDPSGITLVVTSISVPEL